MRNVAVVVLLVAVVWLLADRVKWYDGFTSPGYQKWLEFKRTMTLRKPAPVYGLTGKQIMMNNLNKIRA